MTHILTAHDAELNAAAFMVSRGYTDAVATTGGADGGIDVSSSTALAQVKWRSGMAGRPDLQRLVGAGHGTNKELMFFSASGYTKQAVAYAKTAGVRLFLYDPNGNVEPYGGSELPTGRVSASTQLTRFLWPSIILVALCLAIWLMFMAALRV